MEIVSAFSVMMELDAKTVSNGFIMNKYFHWIYLDLGCNAGGNLSCVEKGKHCLKDGSCGNSI